jgi:hypothetical protein
VGALDRTLRYLGLSGGDPDSLAGDPAAHREARTEPVGLGAGLTFKGEVAGDGDFHIAGRFEGDINVTGRAPSWWAVRCAAISRPRRAWRSCRPAC